MSLNAQDAALMGALVGQLAGNGKRKSPRRAKSPRAKSPKRSPKKSNRRLTQGEISQVAASLLQNIARGGPNQTRITSGPRQGKPKRQTLTTHAAVSGFNKGPFGPIKSAAGCHQALTARGRLIGNAIANNSPAGGSPAQRAQRARFAAANQGRRGPARR